VTVTLLALDLPYLPSESAKLFAAMDDNTVTLVAKFGKLKITLDGLSTTTTISEVKVKLEEKTRVLPHRQKLIGLKAKSGALNDDTKLAELKVKGKSSDDCVTVHQFILMGTPEEEIFVDPSEKGDLPDIVDDFDLDFNAGSDEWIQHKAKESNLQKFTEKTEVHLINQPRPNKPLLVLDLDHTLLDFSSSHLRDHGSSAALIGNADDNVANHLKRPHMDDFLQWTYKYYDLVVWSQTSWRWLEVKLTELGMLTHPGYKITFVLDKTSMFQIVSTNKSGKSLTHYVKPLQIIWSKFPQWSSKNTVHLDDLKRNFALNMSSGLKCTGYYRKKRKKRNSAGGVNDTELLGLGRFCELLATTEVKDNFDDVDFDCWHDYVSGKRELKKKKKG